MLGLKLNHVSKRGHKWPFLTDVDKISLEISAWMINYIYIKPCDVIPRGNRHWAKPSLKWRREHTHHHRDVIMSVMASRITSFMFVYSTVYLGADQRKKNKAPRHWPLWGEFTGEFPAQRASNAENVSIWWCHYVSLYVQAIVYPNKDTGKLLCFASQFFSCLHTLCPS